MVFQIATCAGCGSEAVLVQKAWSLEGDCCTRLCKDATCSRRRSFEQTKAGRLLKHGVRKLASDWVWQKKTSKFKLHVAFSVALELGSMCAFGYRFKL